MQQAFKYIKSHPNHVNTIEFWKAIRNWLIIKNFDFEIQVFRKNRKERIVTQNERVLNCYGVLWCDTKDIALTPMYTGTRLPNFNHIKKYIKIWKLLITIWWFHSRLKIWTSNYNLTTKVESNNYLACK